MGIFRLTILTVLVGGFVLSASPAVLAEDITDKAEAYGEATQIRLEKAKELMDLLRADDIYDGMAISVTRQIRSEVIARTAPDSDEKRDQVGIIVSEEVGDAFHALRSEFILNFAKIYARQFSDEELSDLIAFYASETGKKTLDSLPNTMEQGMALGKYFAQIAVQIVSKKIKDRIDVEVPEEQAS